MLRKPHLFDLTREHELSEEEQTNRVKQRAARHGGGPPLPWREEPTTSRPTVTRVVAGGLLAGPIGALAGFAWRKKTRREP
jgi:hypothetical protein